MPSAADPSDPSAASSATPTVVAVLVALPGGEHLLEHLDALAEQTRPPDRLVAVIRGGSAAGDNPGGPSDPGDPAEAVRSHQGVCRVVADVQTVTVGAGSSVGQAVQRAVEELGPLEGTSAETQWLWLLHDASAPAPTALERLVEAMRRSRTVGIAGPKLVEWQHPRRLVEMGQQVTRTGRRVDAPALGEADQGQYDARTDVLAVGTSGMVVRRDVYDDLHGFDPAFPHDGADLDFGWRAQLAGHRVVVVPAAVVREAPTGRDPLTALRARRRSARAVALTRCSLLAAPFLAVWLVVTSIVGALGLLVLKRPQHAWAELSDLGALAHPWRSARARWRFRHGRRVRRRHLTTLFVSAGAATAATWDRVQDALTPARDRRVGAAGAPGAAGSGGAGVDSTETGPVAEEAESLATLPASLPQRIATNPGFLAVLVCAALSALTFRTALSNGLLDAQGAGLAGGELNAFSTDSSGLWHLFRDSWHGAGFGSSVDVSPGVGVLAALTWLTEWLPYVDTGRSPASVTMGWLLLAAMPLSALTAYLASRVATHARWGRGLVALAWGCSGVLFAALSQGRLSVAIAHILLPLVVAGFAATLKPGGSWTVTFATALAIGVMGAFVPLLLVVAALAALVVVALGPGLARRLKGLALAVVPTLLLGPWVVHFVDEPRLLLTGGGLVDITPDTPSSWQVALGQPDGGRRLLALLFVPLLVVAVLALARRSGGRARSVALTGLTVLALLGLVIALGSERVEVGQAVADDGQLTLATLWAGVGLEIYVAALLAILLTGWHGLTHLLGERRLGWRRLVAAVLAGGVGVAVLGAGALTAWQGSGAVAVGEDALPAVAVDQASGPDANRLLILTPATDHLDYSVIGNEPGALLRDVDRPTSVTDPGVGSVVSELASGAGTITGGAGDALANLGVGFVSLEAGPDSSLARTLDASSGLTRLGTTGNQTLWRVLARPSAAAADVPVPPARVRVVDATGAPLQALPVDGPHGQLDVDLSVGPQGRALVFAQPAEWVPDAVVTLDGTRLEPVDPASTSTPTYLLPTGAGHLSVDLPPAHPRWFLAQLALLAVVVFLAVPFGNKRSRRLR